ncbi:MAG: NTP transferase domain-containing protein [Actinobacteria bacterium]|uniref:Unannotated protein n=1 Tax=freshwater metagenome TaxID=449393 RepID=A0A6J7D8H2_9ZZZZ|nr:NDP-sugar synthase [Actinomycetota bacterium]MSW47553.1 NTP transferase domain-containing protein [Actinomycetota bacterium]MSX24920.1 NTP transferase domain-containing protein [Actinomycetota bacterium]MSY46230.1 NTP transferase domain-containing protein [Actinomycetota bacterium]MSY57102.1 NTP transferase domain-containing protein [Actinomycetota bacterium]
MVQAILLVGGKGTRLMPLTRTIPKPMLPVAGFPVTQHQLAMAKRAGITSVVLATSYLEEVFRPYFGDGSRWGMKIQYAVEGSPLGTGGAIANAAALLRPDEPIVVLNGDILSSHDLSAQIAFHNKNGAAATLHITEVDDARAYGCVPVDANNRVTAFLEKMDNPIAKTINAGCYVFSPGAIDAIPANTVVSIEREVFPELVTHTQKVFGYIDNSYWLDLGTPSALLQGSRDLVQGRAIGVDFTSAPVSVHTNDYIALAGSRIDASAQIFNGSSIGQAVQVHEATVIDGSVVSNGAVISNGAIVRSSFIAEGVTVIAGAVIEASYVGQDGIFPLMVSN